MTADTTPQEELRKEIATIIEHARANAAYFTSGGFDARANVIHETDKVIRLIERKVLEGYKKGWKDAMEQENVPMKGDGNE